MSHASEEVEELFKSLKRLRDDDVAITLDVLRDLSVMSNPNLISAFDYLKDYGNDWLPYLPHIYANWLLFQEHCNLCTSADSKAVFDKIRDFLIVEKFIDE